MRAVSGTVRLLCSLLLVFSSAIGWSQSSNGHAGQRRMADERSVINLRDLEARQSSVPPARAERKLRIHKSIPDGEVPANAIIKFEDSSIAFAAAQAASSPRPLSPPTAVNFLALEDAGNAIPPDTNGAVGPNHLMVTLNTQVRISDRNGTTISTVSLDAFWATVGAADVFDPKVLYDPFNERWMFTAVSAAFEDTSALLIGVSQTSDPTGNWNLFKFDADADNLRWADYPSIGFNKDWIVVSLNMFPIAAPTTFRNEIYVFDKANLYAGGNGNATVFIGDASGTWAPAVTHDDTLGTMHLVQTFNGNSNGNGFLRMATITGPVGEEVFNTPTFVSTPNPWARTGATDLAPDFAPQLGSGAKIDTGDSRLLKVVFRNGALWLTHTIFLPADAPTRAAVQWWKLSPTGTIQQRGRIDDSTGTEFRAYPVVAVNKNDDVLIGYSVFAEGIFAKAAYSFRAGSDPPNTLQSEVDLKLGEAKYLKTFGGPNNRWGDYSNSVVDPLNDLDMWTIQEFAATPVTPPTANSDRWGTWWGKLELPDPDFALLISNPALTVFPGATATFNGTLTAIDGYNSSVTITCQPNHTGIPGTCNGTSATPSAGGQAFSLAASSAVVQDFAFNIRGVGSDPGNITHDQAVTLNVVNFDLTTPNPTAITVVKGNISSAVAFDVEAFGSYSGTVTLDCSGLPAGATCNFSPGNTANPTAGSPVSISLTVSTLGSTADFAGPITITGTSNTPAGVRSESFTLTVTSPVSTSDLSAAVTESFAAARINFGGTANFSVQIANAGPDAATNVLVSLNFTGARLKTSAAGCQAPVGNTISCPVGALLNGGSTTLAFSFEATVAAGIRLNATVTSNSADLVSGNNSSSAFVQAAHRPRLVRPGN